MIKLVLLRNQFCTGISNFLNLNIHIHFLTQCLKKEMEISLRYFMDSILHLRDHYRLTVFSF